ncbi:FERM domain-containing protein 8 [Ditylenchus destructor]|nr:FERM domain-containing protein 8 [Ditylenchus destructor]
MNNNYSSRKPNRKLSQSRGVDLPIIKLDEIPPAGNPRLLRHGFSRITFPGPPSIIRQDDGRSHPATTSPVGYTLRHSSEHALSQDLNRSTISESFNIGQSDEQDVVDIRIFFPNGKGVQFSVENGQQVPSSTLLDLMADHLKIDSEVASEAFALWLISPLLEVQLKPHHVAYEVHAKWPVFLRKFSTASEEEIALDEPLLVLRRNFQLTVQNELISCILYWNQTEEAWIIVNIFRPSGEAFGLTYNECAAHQNVCWARSPETANEDDVPLFLLQYPDDSSDSDKSYSPERKVIQTAVSFTLDTRKKEASDNGITVLEESSVEQTAIDKLEDAPFVNREVYSKQAAMMEALLNSVRNDIYKRPNWVVPPVH